MAAKTSEELRQLMRRFGGTVSDGPLEHGFDEAWGKHPLKGRVAHHWTKVATKQPDAVLYESKCGRRLPVNKMFPMLGPGNYALCENCTRRMIMAGWRPKC